jgi:hypothetical protein
MSMKNEPLTSNEHREIGEQLTRMWSQLLNMGSILTTRYPRSLPIEGDVSDAVAAIDQLRTQMTRQAEKDLGDEFHPAIYHPAMELMSA